MTQLDHIYYFPVDGEGNEVGEPIKIGLNADGSADLSGLPEPMRKTYETWGVQNTGKTNRVLPKSGPAFLAALLGATSGYNRFRTDNTK